MTHRNQLIAVAAAAAALGAVTVALGLVSGDSVGSLVMGLGAGAVLCGAIVAAVSVSKFGPSRRLPEHLRHQAAGEPIGTPVTLTLADDRKILAIAVLAGGYLSPRPTDPPFDARDVVHVEPSSQEEMAAERHRQQGTH